MAKNKNSKLNGKPETIVINKCKMPLIETHISRSGYFCKLSPHNQHSQK